MRLGIGGIYELPRDYAAGSRSFQFFRLGYRALHAQRAFGQHQLGAVCLYELSALY